MRQIIISLIVTIWGTSLVQAQSDNTDFGGLYAGAEVGINDLNIGGGTGSSDTQFAILAGYRFQLRRGLLVGIEGRLDDVGTDGTLTTGEIIKRRREIALDAQVGKVFGKTLVFGSIGFGDAKKLIDDGTITTSAGGTSTRLGVGVEYALLPMVAVRAVGRYVSTGSDTTSGIPGADEWSASAGVLIRF